MRVLVSGAHGLIGSAIVEALRARGDEVGALVRGDAPVAGLDVRWDPSGGTIDEDALAARGFDAVLHLAGESLLGRWTDDKRARILESRVRGTGTLAEALARLERPPAAFLVASAVGFYGDAGERMLTEQVERPGEGFLADVVARWEAAAEPARRAGIRTAHLRMAPVYTPKGGALAAQLTPFRLGLGGRTGSGTQWSPWIGLTEAVRAWLFVLDTQEADGPINLVGPTPARNVDVVRALGRVLRRPTILPTPVAVLKLAMGRDLVQEMLLGSQKTVPARLEGLGYEFLDRTIDDALRRELDT